MGLLMLVLVTATILEKVHGSSFALSNIYHSAWFIALWSVLAVSAMIYIMCVSRRSTLILLHTSFAVTLLGAFVSFMTSQHGTILLTKDAVPASMFTTADGSLERLPFRMRLTGIDTYYIEGTEQVSGYKAYITADDKRGNDTHAVSLNSPMKHKGYSFCIKGVSAESLSLLVARDTYGKPISYIGYLMAFASFIMLFFDKRSGFRRILQQLQESCKTKKGKENISRRIFAGKAGWILAIPFILLCLIWYMRGIFPVTNGAESLLLLALVMTTLAVFFKMKKIFKSLRIILTTVAGITTAVAIFSFECNSSVQPILRTPLLGIHVTTIIIAYALLFCTAINAVMALCTKDCEKRTKQALLGRVLLYPATTLLAAGIFIGAVWANISWGRYWGWDPKEVWALITLLVCSTAFHTQSLRFISKPTTFHVFCIVAFIAMLFTFFGVNYLLGGIHSYA